MKNNLKKWYKNLFTVTPKEWKSLQKKCLAISTALVATWGIMATLPGVDLNGWQKSFAGAIGAFFFVGIFAQGQTTDNSDNKKSESDGKAS